uniref:Uncharacterized protein n=1 Tax=Trichuris muris TaxID=70415 RepID=A0A5S6Q7E2_TRIMR
MPTSCRPMAPRLRGVVEVHRPKKRPLTSSRGAAKHSDHWYTRCLFVLLVCKAQARRRDLSCCRYTACPCGAQRLSERSLTVTAGLVETVIALIAVDHGRLLGAACKKEKGRTRAGRKSRGFNVCQRRFLSWRPRPRPVPAGPKTGGQDRIFRLAEK